MQFEKCHLVTVPTYWCNDKEKFVMYFSARLRIDLQISIFSWTSADLGLNFQQNRMKNHPLSAFDRFGAHLTTKLNTKYKITFYRPSADFELNFQQNRIKNHPLSAFGRFGAQFSTKKNNNPLYRPSADLRLIFPKK